MYTSSLNYKLNFLMEAIYKEIESVSFSSELDNLSVVESIIEDICGRLQIHEDYFGNILIAVTEAVTNAIQHGNRSDKSKEVIVSAQVKDNELIFTITDEGRGFMFTNLPDPTSPENIEKEGGRGIFLMKSLADEVSFLKDGSIVKLTFFIK